MVHRRLKVSVVSATCFWISSSFSVAMAPLVFVSFKLPVLLSLDTYKLIISHANLNLVILNSSNFRLFLYLRFKIDISYKNADIIHVSSACIFLRLPIFVCLQTCFKKGKSYFTKLIRLFSLLEPLFQSNFRFQ